MGTATTVKILVFSYTSTDVIPLSQLLLWSILVEELMLLASVVILNYINVIQTTYVLTNVTKVN